MPKFFSLQKNLTYIFLALAFLFGSGVYMPSATNGQDLESILSQINATNGQISSLQESIKSLQNQTNTLLSQKNSLQSNLYKVQLLLNDANAKEAQITGLISSLQGLKAKADQQLQQETHIKDQGLVQLYESSMENPVFLFLSSTNAKSFLYNLALNEANLGNQKDVILQINSQIKALQDSLNKETQEKALQDQQVASIASQKQQLQSQLAQIQKTYNSLNQQSTLASAQLSVLQGQLGNLSAEEQSIIQAKINASFSQIGGGQSGANTTNPPGSPGTFGVKINNVAIASFAAPLIIVPNNVNTYATVSGNSATTAYTGDIEFRTNTDINFINQTSLENYVKGIAEMPSNWHLEALKTQAIAARTYALNHRGEHASVGYDVTDSTSDQAYNGYTKEMLDSNGNSNPSTPNAGAMYQAGEQTKGLAVYYNNQPADTLYSANNGGYERSNTEVWFTSPAAYLPSQSDGDANHEYNEANSYCQDKFFLPAYGQTNGEISLSGGIGSFYDMAGAATIQNPDQHTDYSSLIQNAIGSFQYAQFTFAFADGSTQTADSRMSYNQIVQSTTSAHGNAHYTKTIVLYGSSGSITIKGGTDPNNTNDTSPNFYESFYTRSPYDDVLTNKLWFFTNGNNLNFFNAGFGHTIGMSQCGAEGRAIAGQSASQILSFYYPNTNIANDAQVSQTDPNTCTQIGNGYPNNDACIRVGITPHIASGVKRDNTIIESGAYSIFANGIKIYSSDNAKGNDTIEVIQN